MASAADGFGDSCAVTTRSPKTPAKPYCQEVAHLEGLPADL